MSDNALVKTLEKSLQIGSLKDLVRVRQSENILLLLDCSGSMADHLTNGQRRIDGLRDAVRGIQSEKELKMVQFGVGFEPSFISSVPNPSGGTPLHSAISFAKNNGAGRAIVISDGIPDNRQWALDAADTFGGRIDVVFVGNPGEAGEAFLKDLAARTGGESFTGDLTAPKLLASAVIGLLNPPQEDDDEDDDDE
jgi:Mg-chelatase subunit ChlD